MTTWQNHHGPILAAAIALLAVVGAAQADSELTERATWQAPTTDAVAKQVDEYLKTQQLDDARKARIVTIWPADAGEIAPAESLEKVAATVATVDDQAAQVFAICVAPWGSVRVPEFGFLADEDYPEFAANNLRLFFGRWLAQQQFYDEAQAQLKGLKPEDVVDPATLLFYQSLTYHWLLNKEQCLPTVSKLLENKETIPTRYATVAELMAADLQPLKTDSLDEIARLMNDIGRRLDLGRAGKTVRKQEEDVIAKLDKLIEELEKQQQQQQQSGSGGSQQSSQPMPDSMPGGGSGPGNVDPKKIGTKSGWGNLPPRERQQTLQELGEDFPSHYREVIEEYFRKLARDGAED